MKVLITGACGFVARALIPELEPRHELRLLDSTSPKDAMVFSPEMGMSVSQPLETDWPVIQADITDADAIHRAAEGMEAIIHLAATYGPPEMAVQTFRVNTVGTFVVLDASWRAGVRRVLCASSVNAFGTFYFRTSGMPVVYDKLPLDEDYPPVPEDAYSLSKRINEETSAAFHRAYGLTTAAFRFAGIWSDALYERAINQGLPPTTAWSDQLYQWVHRADVVQGLRLALEEPALPGYGVYTLGAADTSCPEPTMELIERFRPDLLGTLGAPLVGRAALLSIERARRTFGYAPQFSFSDCSH